MASAPKLIVLSEKLRGKSFELSQDLHTAGRSDERDFCFKDPTVSTHHCDFIRTGEEGNYKYIIRDNNSTNGTRVNNIPIEEQELHNSDIIQVGGVEILFDSEDKSVTTITRTQTGIDLETADSGLATVKDMANLSPFVKNSKKNAVSQKILIVLVALLGVFIVGLLGYIIFLIFAKGEGTPASLFSLLFQ